MEYGFRVGLTMNLRDWCCSNGVLMGLGWYWSWNNGEGCVENGGDGVVDGVTMLKLVVVLQLYG